MGFWFRSSSKMVEPIAVCFRVFVVVFLCFFACMVE